MTLRTVCVLCGKFGPIGRERDSYFPRPELDLPFDPYFPPIYLSHWRVMLYTRQAAAKLRLAPKTLSRYIAAKKVPASKIVTVGSASLHSWTAGFLFRWRSAGLSLLSTD